MVTLKKRIKHLLFYLEGLYASRKSSVSCPICKHSYSHFYTYNARKNALCFHCRSLERDRSLHIYLEKRTDIFLRPNVKLLHFAPEISLYPVLKRSVAIDYVTADLSVTLNNYLQVVPDYVMSVTDIKFDDNTFDYLICNHVLDDVDDDVKALNEFYRVLKKGGTAILSVPLNLNLAETIEFDESPEKIAWKKNMNISFENKRYYGTDVKVRMEKAGFDVKHLTAAVLVEDMEKHGLRTQDVIYICFKK